MGNFEFLTKSYFLLGFVFKEISLYFEVFRYFVWLRFDFLFRSIFELISFFIKLMPILNFGRKYVFFSDSFLRRFLSILGIGYLTKSVFSWIQFKMDLERKRQKIKEITKEKEKRQENQKKEAKKERKKIMVRKEKEKMKRKITKLLLTKVSQGSRRAALFFFFSFLPRPYSLPSGSSA